MVFSDFFEKFMLSLNKQFLCFFIITFMQTHCDSFRSQKLYRVEITHIIPVRSYIVYRAQITNLAFPIKYTVHFRYRTLKKFHANISKYHESLGEVHAKMPQFPKTNSIIGFNKTNTNYKLLVDRMRSLQFYLDGVLNYSTAKISKYVVNLLKQASYQNKNQRCKSNVPTQFIGIVRRSKSCQKPNTAKEFFFQLQIA